VRAQKTIDSLSFKEETGNIKNLLSQSKKGDYLLLEVKKVQRMNFMNRDEVVHLPIITKTIPIE